LIDNGKILGIGWRTDGLLATVYHLIGQYEQAGSADLRATEALMGEQIDRLDRPIMTSALEKVEIGCGVRI
jgi:hypothetical protein